MKSMVALLLLWGTAACTDEVLVDMEKPGIENNSPEAGHITSLKNILPDAKPGYQGVDSRADNSWVENDELLLKIQIKDGDVEKYTAWMTLLFDGTNWNIKSTTTGEGVNAVTSYAYFAQKADATNVSDYNTLPLVTPATGIILNNGANFKAIIPEEISNPNVQVELIYAPDLEWKDVTSAAEEGEDDAATTTSIALQKKSNTLTETPEYWTVQPKAKSNPVEYEWTTTLARVCVKTGEAGDIVTLNSTSFEPLSVFEKSSDGIYTATTIGTDGIAYFYGTLGETTSDFNISLKQVKISSSAAEQPSLIDAFIPTTLFEANTLNKVTLVAKTSYLLDGTAARTQAFNDSKGATVSGDGKTYTVSGVNGLLEWVAALNNADGEINLNLELENDIVLPQFEISTEGTASNNNLKYYYAFDKPITYDENGVPTNSNWISVSRGSRNENGNIVYYGLSGTIDGNDKVISGLRTNNSVGLVHTLEQNSEIKDLKFVNAIINNPGNAAVIVSLNKGNVTNCTVAHSKVKGVGDVGAVVATNEGTVSGCHNVSTDVISSNNEFENGSPKYKRASELVGGVVGQNVGEKSTDENRKQGVVTNCTNSGKVISNGMAGNNFTGGIVGHSYGIVSYCTNKGYVESSTDGSGYNKTAKNDDGTTVISKDPSSGYYTSVGGVVGNCSFGRVIACINEGKVKSGTTTAPSAPTHNRVGGVVGYSGTESHVVACGNTGNIEISGADKDHVGGIVGHLYHSYADGDDRVVRSIPGKVYASWTKEVLEKGDTNATAGDGIGDIDDKDNNTETTGVFVTKVFNNMSLVDNTSIASMNSVINNTDSTKDFYNRGLNSGTVKYCSKIWSYTPGSWPTFPTGTTSTNP